MKVILALHNSWTHTTSQAHILYFMCLFQIPSQREVLALATLARLILLLNQDKTAAFILLSVFIFKPILLFIILNYQEF